MCISLNREWFGVCEESVHTLFHYHPAPDRVVSLVLQHMYAHLNTPSSTSSGDSSASGDRSVCGIARLLFLLGQTSLCSLVYTEFLASVAKKYPLKDSAAKTDAKSNKKAASGANKASASTFKEDEVEVDAMEEEMGAAAAADADHERVSCHWKLFDIFPHRLKRRRSIRHYLAV